MEKISGSQFISNLKEATERLEANNAVYLIFINEYEFVPVRDAGTQRINHVYAETAVGRVRIQLENPYKEPDELDLYKVTYQFYEVILNSEYIFDFIEENKELFTHYGRLWDEEYYE